MFDGEIVQILRNFEPDLGNWTYEDTIQEGSGVYKKVVTSKNGLCFQFYISEYPVVQTVRFKVAPSGVYSTNHGFMVWSQKGTSVFDGTVISFLRIHKLLSEIEAHYPIDMSKVSETIGTGSLTTKYDNNGVPISYSTERGEWVLGYLRGDLDFPIDSREIKQDSLNGIYSIFVSNNHITVYYCIKNKSTDASVLHKHMKTLADEIEHKSEYSQDVEASRKIRTNLLTLCNRIEVNPLFYAAMKGSV